MNEARLVEIIWAETEWLEAADRSDLEVVRRTVAELALAGHVGLLARAQPRPAPGGPSDDAVEQCRRAAREALAAESPPPARAALWLSTPLATGANDAPRGPDWLYGDAQVLTSSGPLSDRRFASKTLRLYRSAAEPAGDAGAAWRSWPREEEARQVLAAALPLSPPPPPPEPVPARVVWIGKGLAALSLALFVLAAVWSFWLGDLSRRTLVYFDAVGASEPPHQAAVLPLPPDRAPPAPQRAAQTAGQDCIAAVEAASRAANAAQGSGATTGRIRPEAWQLKPAELRLRVSERTDCASRWAALLSDAARSKPTSFTPIGEAGLMENFGRWLASFAAGGGRLTLSWPLGLTMIAIATFIVATGFILMGRWSGWLIDGDNRMSLARTQLAAWSAVLLGGLTSLGCYNIGLQSELMRRTAQIATESAERITALNLPDAADAEGVLATTIRSTIRFFPSMDWQLWALVGLIGGTAAIAPLLNAQKRDRQRLVRKASAKAASLEDLFVSDDPAQAQRVDLSRVQQIVATGTVLAGYTQLVFAYSRGVDGVDVIRALTTGASVFTAMPPVDTSFLGLLGISTGAYLGTKYLGATT